MKLYTIIALIASAAAIKLSQKESHDLAPKHMLLEEATKILSLSQKTTQ